MVVQIPTRFPLYDQEPPFVILLRNCTTHEMLATVAYCIVLLLSMADMSSADCDGADIGNHISFLLLSFQMEHFASYNMNLL